MTRIIQAGLKHLSLMLLSCLAVAAAARAQGTYTAASCNYTDVNAVINGPTHTAVNGDIIILPAGTCTWTSQLSYSVGITLTGSGGPANSGSGTTGAATSTTTIMDDYTASGPILNATVAYGYMTRISLLNIEPYSSSTSLTSPIFVVGTCTSSGCPNLRADNLTFTGWTESGNGTQSAWMLRTDGVYGVIDHNTIPSSEGTSGLALANVHYSSWLGVGQYGDNSWSQPDSFGTANQLYFENNSLSVGSQDCDETPGTTGGGCRITVRHNQFTIQGTGVPLYFHGTETTDRVRGGRQAEFYGNTITCTNTSTGCPTGAEMRSGVILNYANTYTTGSGSWFDNYVELDAYRTFSGFPPWGYCAGQGSYDDNDGTVYASGAISSVSTSSGLTIADSSKSWSANQWVDSGDPYSIVDLSASGGVSGTSPGYEITASTSNSVSAANYSQDYWNGPPTFSVGDSYEILRSSFCIDQPSRSGGTYISGSTPSPSGWVGEILDPSYEWNDTLTAGSSCFHGNVGSDTAKIIANRDYYAEVSGIQTSPTSPFNGASGTGWGTLANRPTSCTAQVGYFATDANDGNGELYECLSASTWTGVYQSYAYPHPLDTGGTAPNPPTSLVATAH